MSNLNENKLQRENFGRKDFLFRLILIMSASKGVPLTKDKVKYLIELIEGQAVITSKATNTTNNKLKDEAWRKITDQFNASVSTGRRKPEQLRLKWENLKKAARKRATSIRVNNLKTGGGKADTIPPDDSLDHVASILGSTCKGLPVIYGGDAAACDDIILQPSSSLLVVGDGLLEDSHNVGDLNHGNFTNIPNGEYDGGDADVVMVDSGRDGTIMDFTPRGYRFMSGTKRSAGKIGQRKSKDDESLDIRNKMIAEYYNVKKRKVELEIEEKLLNNDKIKEELEKLRLENEKLKLELKMLKKD